jgi:phytoene synthase
VSDALTQSYRLCREISRRTAKNFYYSFLVMPRAKRDAMCAIYAFMRRSDDIADSAANPAVALTGLQQWRATVEAAFCCAGVSPAVPDGTANRRDACSTVTDPILPALVDTVRRYRIAPRYFFELLDGTEMDQAVTRYETFDDLYRYCYRVASCVGLVVLPVFGYEDDKALVPAEACGIAFQLTNILRDVKEDAALGRVYLPAEDMRRFGVSEADVMNAQLTPQFRELLKFEADRAREYYRQASPLLGLVAKDSRATLAVMIGIYGGILDKIVAREYDVFAERARLSATEKLGIVAKNWWRYRR